MDQLRRHEDASCAVGARLARRAKVAFASLQVRPHARVARGGGAAGRARTASTHPRPTRTRPLPRGRGERGGEGSKVRETRRVTRPKRKRKRKSSCPRATSAARGTGVCVRAVPVRREHVPPPVRTPATRPEEPSATGAAIFRDRPRVPRERARGGVAHSRPARARPRRRSDPSRAPPPAPDGVPRPPDPPWTHWSPPRSVRGSDGAPHRKRARRADSRAARPRLPRVPRTRSRARSRIGPPHRGPRHPDERSNVRAVVGRRRRARRSRDVVSASSRVRSRRRRGAARCACAADARGLSLHGQLGEGQGHRARRLRARVARNSRS